MRSTSRAHQWIVSYCLIIVTLVLYPPHAISNRRRAPAVSPSRAMKNTPTCETRDATAGTRRSPPAAVSLRSSVHSIAASFIHVTSRYVLLLVTLVDVSSREDPLKILPDPTGAARHTNRFRRRAPAAHASASAGSAAWRDIVCAEERREVPERCHSTLGIMEPAPQRRQHLPRRRR